MRKTFKKYFIPHEGNDYKPHFFKDMTAGILSSVIVIAFLATTFQALLLFEIDLIAAIFPSVLVDRTNDTRSEYGLNTLKINERLVEAAQAKANDMASRSYFAHNSPDGKTPWYWISQSGYNYLYAGENLAVNFSDSVNVHNAWLDSPGHRANIVHQHFTEIGIAMADGIYEGRPTTFVVQMFGRPVPGFDLSPRETISTISTDSEVAGDSTVLEAVAVSEQDTSQFVAVKNTEHADIIEQIENDPDDGILQAGEELGKSSYSSFFAKVITSPRQTLSYVYVFIATLIALALVLSIFIEIRRQHPNHIALSLILLVLMILFLYLNKELLGTVLIA